MVMELKNLLKVAICMIFFTWIVTGSEMSTSKVVSDEDEANCTDTVDDCDAYNYYRLCNTASDRPLAMVACRKHCGLCKECVIPSSRPKNANMTLSWEGKQFMLNYRCHAGHSLINGSLTRTCYNSTWSGSIPNCLPDCKDIKSVPINNTRNQTADGNRYGSKATVTCKEGYVVSNNYNQTAFNMSCSSDGVWQNKLDCVPVDCANVTQLKAHYIQSIAYLPNTKFMSIATATCEVGHVVPGGNNRQNQFNTTCASDGSWKNVTSCVRIDCGKIILSNIPNAKEIYFQNDTKYESSANISCDEGFTVANQTQTKDISSTVVKCKENGNWEKLPTCLKKDCGDIHILSIENAAVRRNVNGNKFGAVAQIDCDVGYYHRNQTTEISITKITCSETGEWTDIPTCRRKDCKNIANLGLNYINLPARLDKDTMYNSTADVDCKEGYYNKKQNQTTGISTTTMFCSDKGTWINMPTCELKDCGPLKDLTISNAGLRLLFSGTNYGSYAAITCDEGYYDLNQHGQPEGMASTLITCSVNGTWTGLPNCSRKDCGDVNALYIDRAGSRSQDNGTTYKSTANVKCDEGYFIQGQTQLIGISTQTITCSNTGKWTDVPICIPKDCGRLQNITMMNAGSRVPINGTKYTSVANVSCDVGFKDKDETQVPGVTGKIIRCNESGVWDNLPKCVRKVSECKWPYVAPNKSLHIVHTATEQAGKTFVYQDKISYTCIEGYEFSNGNKSTVNRTIECSFDATWSDFDTCRKINCGSLDMLNISDVASKLLFTDTQYGSNAVVTCITGYYDKNKAQMKGVSSTMIKCSENGTWVKVPNCVRKDCGNLTYIKIAHAFHRRLHTDTKFESTADIDCDDGYYIKGRIQTAGISTQTITCSDTGTWINMPECVPKDCGPLSAPGNGYVTVAQNRTVYGTIATYKCDPGFFMAGLETARCMASGHWSNNSTHCQIKDCGLLMPPNDGFVVTLNGTKFGASSEFRCNPGYTLYGDYFTTCLSNGTWQHYNMNCMLNKKAMPTICFSCDGMSSPEYCDKVEHCQANQICYTESYQTDYGKVFRSGCMNEQQCQREENSTSNSVCVECCTSEMCNNKGCGNADFPPRAHRGPMCFDCQHIGDINSCRKVTMCASDQVCSIEKQQWGDTYHYKLGCTHHLCNSLLHQISGTVSSCHGCCSDDYCNKNCTSSSSSPGEIFVG